MYHNHNHIHCLHTQLAYCSVCDVVYCKSCGREWTNPWKISWSPSTSPWTYGTSSAGDWHIKTDNVTEGHTHAG